MRGLRAGAIVLVGIGLANVGNYGFHLLSGRYLGPARYGDLATLVAVVGLISLPLGALQVWVARYVARYHAARDDDAVHWFVRRVGVYCLAVGTVITVGLTAVAWPVQQLLDIASIAAVVLTALTALPAFASSVTWGLTQGLQRFTLFATAYGLGPASRVAFTLVAFAAGLKTGGAMLATVASMLVSLLVPLWILRRWFSPAAAAGRRITRGDAARSLVPVAVGLLAITSLTTVDVVVAKAALSEHDAGIYGSASLVGRVILYLPAAIITVLLPRVAARAAENRDTVDLLRKSLAVTAGFCAAATLLYTVASEPVVRIAFGAEYEDAASLLWRFAVAMSLFAVVNVLLVYHLARDATRMAWLLGVAALVQLVAFAFAHDDAEQLLLIDIVSAGALLVAHELFVEPTFVRALGLVRRPRPT